MCLSIDNLIVSYRTTSTEHEEIKKWSSLNMRRQEQEQKDTGRANFIDYEGYNHQMAFQPRNYDMSPLCIESLCRNLHNFGILGLLSS